jgi:hypothetical protein
MQSQKLKVNKTRLIVHLENYDTDINSKANNLSLSGTLTATTYSVKPSQANSTL